MMRLWMGRAALFLGYGAIGFGGDWASGLLADEAPAALGAGTALEPDSRVRGGPGECAWSAERSVTLGASAAEELRLVAGSGELLVEGRPGLGAVRAVGRVCASEEAWLDDLQVTLEREDGRLVLVAHYPDRDGSSGWRGSEYARIDLTVEIPRGMPVDIEDSSGEMEVTGAGALRIADSSGSIRVEGAGGPVRIDDSSGGIEVQDVDGDVEIEDGSGEVEIAGVRGRVRVLDGSGSIRALEIEGDVLVEADGSGSIEVRDVRGDFTVRADGSGGVRYSGVGGVVDIPDEGRRRGR